ncbi:MAG TPA: SPOR domain-containing protein [Vicinamibacterales bacterium]
MASPTTDDGFHEIQLNGKQLVFLFMAATVVSVVIFLCGVLVGRGVRAERTVAQAAALNEAPDILPSEPAASPSAIQAGADPRTAAPPAPVDEKSTTVGEDIRPDSAKAAEARETVGKPATAPAPAPSAPKSEKASGKPADKSEKSAKAEKVSDKPAAEKSTDKAAEKTVEKSAPKPEQIAAASSAPKESAPAASPTSGSAAATPSDGYAVQVAAVNARNDADVIAKRFSSKGYSAYVEVPPNGTGTVFRVRIGTFKTKREAETIAAKLQKEEQIKPWVTR